MASTAKTVISFILESSAITKDILVLASGRKCQLAWIAS
jgi:hypothetical protein